MNDTTLPGIVAEHIAAVNRHDLDGLLRTFRDDAYVNDNRREIRGIAAIRRWAEHEIVGDRVSMNVLDVTDHHGETIVRAAYDGDFDKTNLPEQIVLSNYFRVTGDKITGLIIVFNQPSPYGSAPAMEDGGPPIRRACDVRRHDDR